MFTPHVHRSSRYESHVSIRAIMICKYLMQTISHIHFESHQQQLKQDSQFAIHFRWRNFSEISEFRHSSFVSSPFLFTPNSKNEYLTIAGALAYSMSFSPSRYHSKDRTFVGEEKFMNNNLIRFRAGNFMPRQRLNDEISKEKRRN